MVLLIVLYVFVMLAIFLSPTIREKIRDARLRRKAIIENWPPPEMEAEIMSRNWHIHVVEKLHSMFDKTIIREKGYLDPNLSIMAVAKMFNTNRTYLSEAINKNYGMPFRILVNKLRIEHAKKMLLDNPDMTVVAVARQSGFLGANQFVRKFKELEGNTPGEWRRLKLFPELVPADENPVEENITDENITDENLTDENLTDENLVDENSVGESSTEITPAEVTPTDENPTDMGPVT